MKVGTIKVKRNYQIAQMVLDAAAVIIYIVIVRCVISFGEYITYQNSIIIKSNSEITSLVEWRWNIIWIVLGALVIAASLLMIYLPKKMPKKYKVNEDNAQRYSDIVITAITCIRVPVLLAVFEGMYIHQAYMMMQKDELFSIQIPLDILLIIIIIRFSLHRIKAIQPKSDRSEPFTED